MSYSIREDISSPLRKEFGANGLMRQHQTAYSWSSNSNCSSTSTLCKTHWTRSQGQRRWSFSRWCSPQHWFCCHSQHNPRTSSRAVCPKSLSFYFLWVCRFIHCTRISWGTSSCKQPRRTSGCWSVCWSSRDGGLRLFPHCLFVGWFCFSRIRLILLPQCSPLRSGGSGRYRRLRGRRGRLWCNCEINKV